MQHLFDVITTAYSWVWTTVGWWLVALFAALAVVAGVVEWRRR